MADCVVPGWGTGPWGTSPWGGSYGPVVGGPLPTVDPFDVYCLGPCGPMATILTHVDVVTVGDGSHFLIGLDNFDLVISSGGVFLTDDAQVHIVANVPATWTYEFTIKLGALPSNFSDLVHRHIFVGTTDAQGNVAGLFFARTGLMYTGAVHFVAGDLVLDNPTQPLPDSQLLVEENEYFTIRIATDVTTNITYIYMTKTSDLGVFGHQLRYVLPALQAQTEFYSPTDGSVISVRGTAGEMSSLSLDSICLGSGLVIPNLPPRADAGPDQAIRTCSVALLDGSKSFDPEGANITFQWRLIDAPLGSQYIFDGVDGLTYPLPVPTGFTDSFYSATLGVLHGQDPLLPGDVLLLDGEVHVIQSTGDDESGFFVRVEGYTLPDDLSSATTFKLLFQRGISSPQTEKPTFYPDVPGLFKFDLTVFDGGLFSPEASVTIVNVTESPIPRGCTPDLSFLWGYLSDFWKLVEDKERIEVFWGGVAQIAAAELLNVWQLEYSKSLRDIQRTFQRRWLRYDLLMQEDPILLERTTVRAVFGGIEAANTLDYPISTEDFDGDFLDVEVDGATHRITISGGSQLTPTDYARQIAAQLQHAYAGFSVRELITLDGTLVRLRIDAPFAFSILSTSTLSLFSAGTNSYPTGTGAVMGAYTYRVDKSLQDVPIQEGDFLLLDGIAYRIVRATTNDTDTYRYQRITTSDPLPLDASTTWAISGQATSVDIDFWSSLVSEGDLVTLEVIRLSDNALLYVPTEAMGASPQTTRTLALDAGPVGLYLNQPELYSVFLSSIARRRYVPTDPLVVDVPYLQEFIKTVDDEQVLRRNVDFFLETFRGGKCIRFVVGSSDVWQGGTPPPRLWAETTYLDNRPTIEANFGIPAEFTLDDLSQLPSSIDYLSTVRGLWYAYFNGPTIFNLRAGTQMLLGLPFVEEEGVIEEIRDDFSAAHGRILIRDTANAEIVRSYSFPHSLEMEVNPETNLPYAVGDVARLFAPLVVGVEVLDHIKSPRWFEGYLQQGTFFEVEKFFKFLVRVNSAIFNLNSLLFVKSFVSRIKPTSSFPLFVVQEELGNTEISVTDSRASLGILSLNAAPGNQWTSPMWDDPNPAGGGWRGRYDDNGATPPVYPTSTTPVAFGYDRPLAPADIPHATLSTTFGGLTYPTEDSLFAMDSPVFTAVLATFSDRYLPGIPATPGVQVGLPYEVTANDTMDTIQVDFQGTQEDVYFIIMRVNGVDTDLTGTPLSGAGNDSRHTFFIPIPGGQPVIIGDIIEVFIYGVSGSPVIPDWNCVEVIFGTSVPWTYDAQLPAGDYASYRSL